MSSTLHLEQHICPACSYPARVHIAHVMVRDDPAPRPRVADIWCTNPACLHFVGRDQID